MFIQNSPKMTSKAWQLQLASGICFYLQLLSLFIFWVLGILNNTIYQWGLVVLVFFIAGIAVFFVYKYSSKHKFSACDKKEKVVRLLLAVVSPIALYLVFVPFVYMMNKNKAALILFLCAVIAVPVVIKFAVCMASKKS